VDQFGVSWRKATPGAPAHPTGPSATISPDYPRLPDPRDARRFEPVREAVAAGRDSFKVAMWRGPFEVSGFILTAEGLLADLAAEPARAARVLAAVTDFECALVDQVAGLGVDAIMIGDDYGHQHGPLVSPATWRRLIRPCLQALIERVKAHGLPFALHSDGAIGQLVGDLVDIGVDILNPVQPECCDPFALKREFGRRLTFHGATSSQGLFVRGRPEEVRRHLRETARVMSQRGGYIMAPSFVILAGTPVENALAFLDILDELRGA
jgi:uroporphyrinogen decarboxylase